MPIRANISFFDKLYLFSKSS